VGARAYAVDLGSLYKFNSKLTLAAVLTNFGTKMKFIDQADSLPLAFRLGAAYRVTPQIGLTTEGVYRQNGLASFHAGTEWRPSPPIALRVGYKTDTLPGLSPLAGLTMGIGIHAWGHEFSYAWLPLGELGNTQYFSLVLKFGGATAERRNLIQYQRIKRERVSETSDDQASWDRDLMDLLENEEKKPAVAQQPRPRPNRYR
jgi:hypothetical protein